MIELISGLVGLITAILSIAIVIIQRVGHDQEQKAYRQQLISLLHHSEGLRDSINGVQMSMLRGPDDPNAASNMLIYNILDTVKQNANALFFGIMETKVGGKQILDDLDSKYKKWSSLELDRKITAADNSVKVTKNFLKNPNYPINSTESKKA